MSASLDTDLDQADLKTRLYVRAGLKTRLYIAASRRRRPFSET
jgi:hypothetical protein